MVSADNWHMLLVVLGLVGTLLASATGVTRYQEYKARQRARLKALVTQAARMEQVLQLLKRVPLSRSLRQALWQHQADQYVAIRRLHSGYPSVGEQLEAALARVGNDGGVTEGSVPAINGVAEYQRLLAALEELILFLKHRGRSLKDGAKHLDDWHLEVRERRAEVDTRYMIVEAHRAQVNGNTKKASSLLHTLLTRLRTRGPRTGFVEALCNEVSNLHDIARLGGTIMTATGADPAA